MCRRTAKSQALCRLLVLLGALAAVTGCGEPQRKVVAAWRGDFIGESKAKEEVKFSPPVLDLVASGGEPGSLQIEVKQRQLTMFSLEKRYQKVGAVRQLSAEQVEQLRGDSAKTAHVSIFLGSMWLVPPAGASLTAGAAVMERKQAKKKDEAEENAIQQLRSGESTVTIPVNYRWSTLETEYKREIVGEEKEPVRAGSEEEMVAAVQVLLKIEISQYTAQQKRVRTDDFGRASFVFAKTPAEARVLKPEKWKISAKWAGKWQEIGAVQLTHEWIAQVMRDLREQDLRAVGKPELPPAATLSLKVSNGWFRAGMDSDLALTVLNTGEGEFYHLEATTESVVPALNGLTFQFGKISPGERLTLVRKIHIPHQQPPGQAVVRFQRSELNGYAPGPVEAGVPVKGSSNY